MEISIQIDGGSDAHVTRPLVVLTNSLAQAKAAGRPPLARDRGCVILAVHDLSSRRLVPGTPLSGTLVLSPWRRWTARAVNVALVRREHVHHGPWNGNDPSRNPAYEEKEVDVVVARQDLADRRALEPGRTERLPFILPVPHDLRAPSIQTPEFEISWLLRGWLDRRWLPDPFIEVELHAVTVA